MGLGLREGFQVPLLGVGGEVEHRPPQQPFWAQCLGRRVRGSLGETRERSREGRRPDHALQTSAQHTHTAGWSQVPTVISGPCGLNPVPGGWHGRKMHTAPGQTRPGRHLGGGRGPGGAWGHPGGVATGHRRRGSPRAPGTGLVGQPSVPLVFLSRNSYCHGETWKHLFASGYSFFSSVCKWRIQSQCRA